MGRVIEHHMAGGQGLWGRPERHRVARTWWTGSCYIARDRLSSGDACRRTFHPVHDGKVISRLARTTACLRRSISSCCCRTREAAGPLKRGPFCRGLDSQSVRNHRERWDRAARPAAQEGSRAVSGRGCHETSGPIKEVWEPSEDEGLAPRERR